MSMVLAGALDTSALADKVAAKLEAGDTWLEFRFSGTANHQWLLSAGNEDTPLGMVPGNVRFTLKNDDRVRLVFAREGGAYVTPSLSFGNGTLAITPGEECADSFAYSTQIVTEHHAIVTITLKDSPLACSPAFATSKSRYGIGFRATKGTAQEIYVVYDDLKGFFHRFSPTDNEADVSVPATIDHTVVFRGAGFFDCAKRVKYVFKKGGAISVDGQELGIKVDAPPGTAPTPVTCALTALPK